MLEVRYEEGEMGISALLVDVNPVTGVTEQVNCSHWSPDRSKALSGLAADIEGDRRVKLEVVAEAIRQERKNG